jgi:rhamnosyltransferase subunit B
MHYLLVTVGTAGDMFPFMSMALALQRRGHRVTLAGPLPHAHYAEQAGLPFQALGSEKEFLAVVADPDLWHPRKGLALVMRGMRAGLELLPAYMDTLPLAPCVMVAHPLVLAAAQLCRTGRPQLRIAAVFLAPSNLRTVHDPLTLGPLPVPRWVPLAWRRWLFRRLDASLIDPHALPDLNAARLARKLPPVPHFVDHMQEVADLSVTLFPDWFGKTQPDWPRPLLSGQFQLYDPNIDAALPAALQAFLSQGARPVVFTPGSGNRHAAAYFSDALHAVGRLGIRAVFLTPHREQVPAQLPPAVLWQAYLPFRALLPHVAALVHHGGIGTTAEALRAGIPQLVVPLGFDQFDNGARVRALGAGTVLFAPLAPRFRRRSLLVRKLRWLLSSDALAARCREVAARFDGNAGLDSICEAIESLAAQAAAEGA